MCKGYSIKIYVGARLLSGYWDASAGSIYVGARPLSGYWDPSAGSQIFFGRGVLPRCTFFNGIALMDAPKSC